MTYRKERLNSLLRQEISDLVQRQVKDPRLGSFVSITAVQISSDMRYAKVFVSRLGTDIEKKETLTALASASGYIRHELGERLKTRRIPELNFKLDETIEKANKVLRIIDEIASEEGAQS
ncbi:MAG: 30S ribosome-binding factor RbfA [Dehalococcoidales bacterium]|nr:30S ribosome-binding factor RbfA [Dehalococcoidales bacterium]